MNASNPARRRFWIVALAALAARLGLSALLPITGDEAYFVEWARHPALGYYDHPPMIGWIQTLLLPWGPHPWITRLPATLCFALIAWLAVRLLRREGFDPARAWDAGTLLSLAPLPFYYALVTTDTPLVLFAFLSGAAWLDALRTGRRRDFVRCGAWLGLAFLSKYFAVLLGLAYAAWALLFERSRRSLVGTALVAACALPAVLLHLAWNRDHAWMTLLFHFQSRLGAQSGFAWSKPLIFVTMQLALATPVLALLLWRDRGAAASALRASAFTRRCLFLFVFPLALLGLNALRVKTGFHWTLAFYAFFYLAVALLLPTERAPLARRALGAWTAVHAPLLAAALLVPASAWAPPRLQRARALVRNLEPLRAELRPLTKAGFATATTGYTLSALLAYDGSVRPGVFLSDSQYGRAYDLWDDWSALEGRDVAVLTPHAAQIETIARHFASSEVRRIEAGGAELHLVLGRGFRYAEYRPHLDALRARFYTPPAGLPSRWPAELLR